MAVCKTATRGFDSRLELKINKLKVMKIIKIIWVTICSLIVPPVAIILVLKYGSLIHKTLLWAFPSGDVELLWLATVISILISALVPVCIFWDSTDENFKFKNK